MLKEGEDYYLDENGRMVLTAAWLTKRGFCCGNGCRHCPYNYENVKEPRRTWLRDERAKQCKEDIPEE